MSAYPRCNWAKEALRIWETVPPENKGYRKAIDALPYSAMDKTGIMEKLRIAWNARGSTICYMGMTEENQKKIVDGD